MPMVVHDIIISFANGVKKILGDDLKKIIRKTQTLTLWS